jgi:hypothetical protein
VCYVPAAVKPVFLIVIRDRSLGGTHELMDFGKLDRFERLAAYGAIASIVGAILAQIGFTAGGLWLTLLLAIAMLVLVFLPQWSPQTNLPGSKGSLMLVIGGIAALGSLLGLFGLLGLLGLLGFYGGLVTLGLIGLLIGIVGGFVMGLAGWQAFQAEGGKFQIGNSGSGTPPPPAAPPPPPATPPPPPAEPPTT